ncbi:MAG: hypothetical protein R3F56_10440 [Planctomycetota bacterium]
MFTPQLLVACDQALTLVKAALEGEQSKAAFDHRATQGVRKILVRAVRLEIGPADLPRRPRRDLVHR